MQIIKRCIVLIILLFPLFVFAQKRENVKGEYTFVVPKDMSINEAKKVALERAKIDALSKEFGTTLSQDNTTISSGEDKDSETSFYFLGTSSVKGEWIETIGEPKYTTRYENDMFIITVNVAGKAREIIDAKIDVDAKILRNGIEDRFESSAFKDGDDLFVSFASPADGYLSIYLVNQENKAYCLLPYISNKEGKTKINAGERHLFFSARDVDANVAHLVDEYNLSCEGEIKYNTLYFIFSTNEFTKALDVHSDKSRPRQLSLEKFDKWLVDLKTKSTDVQLIKKTIHISK